MELEDLPELPNHPLVRDALCLLAEVATDIEISVRVRAANIIYEHCENSDMALITATLVFGLVRDRVIAHEFGEEVVGYTRDIRHFHQQSRAMVLAASKELKTFYLALSLAAAEDEADYFEDEILYNYRTPEEELINLQVELMEALLEVETGVEENLVDQCYLLIDRIDELLERKNDMPRLNRIKPGQSFTDWMKKSGKPAY